MAASAEIAECDRATVPPGAAGDTQVEPAPTDTVFNDTGSRLVLFRRFRHRLEDVSVSSRSMTKHR